jgi:hypothetical protein
MCGMARDDDDDLYEEEFDFVDDDDDGDREDASDVENDSSIAAEDDSRLDQPQDDEDEPVDEYGRPEPKADYVVHVYEQKKFKRTIDRPFTPEDAEAFATEYNRTGKSYGRMAVAGKNDAKPKKALD